MLLDHELPPSRLPSSVQVPQIDRHFLEAFGIRVDLDGLDALPALERQRLASARPLEPPEAVLLDRVLQLVPRELLQSVERVCMLQTRGTARFGGSLQGIIGLSAEEARVRERDRRFTGSFSLFTTTLLHELA